MSANDRRKGTGYGKGHHGNTSNLPVIRETYDATIQALAQAGQLQEKIRTFKAGKLFIMLGYQAPWGWHLSISHRERYPTWDEIAYARYELIPDEAKMVMMLPPKSDYINVDEFTFHLHEAVILDTDKISVKRSDEFLAQHGIVISQWRKQR